MANINAYGSLRIRLSTMEYLKDLKDAFEASYGQKFTMDMFIHKMADSIEDGDPGVWEIYCTRKIQKHELQIKIINSQRLREEKKK